jgi:hypothetical protein
MSHRPIAGFLLLLAASCLASPPPPATSSPSDKSAKAPAPGADAGSGAEGCGKFKIQSKDQFEACNKKCKDDQQDQQRQCGDPQCQQGIGQGARLCLGKCEEGQTAARTGKCYKE